MAASKRCVAPTSGSSRPGFRGLRRATLSGMADELKSKTIAFLVATEGIEQVELTEPWKAVEGAGGSPRLVSLEGGKVQAFNHLDKADTFDVDETVEQADVATYDGLVLPGGVANPDQLRTDKKAVA